MRRSSYLIVSISILALATWLLATVASSEDPESIDGAVEENTQTSMQAHEVEPPPTEGYRVTMLDSIVRFDGPAMDEGAADALDNATGGLCSVEADKSAVRSVEGADAPASLDAAIGALSSFDCSVTVFILEISSSGGLSGFVATTDEGRVDDLQAQLGEQVRVEIDYVGTSPGPPGVVDR